MSLMAVEVCATQGPRPPAQVPSAYQASDVLLGGAGWWEVTQGVRSRLPRLLRAGCAASGESLCWGRGHCPHPPLRREA